MSNDDDTAVHFEKFTFSYEKGGKPILSEISLDIPRGSRVLVVGLNGSGKSSLLRCAAGKHFHGPGEIRILNKEAYFETPNNLITYLGGSWRSDQLVRKDVSVKQLISSYDDQERVKFLMELLDIEPKWRLHAISDGQRQAVQLMLGMIRRAQLVLLDEVTVDLDVLVRKRFLEFLKEEKHTVLYATHIFDMRGSWPTHILHVRNGTTKAGLVQLDSSEEYRQLCDTWTSTDETPLMHMITNLLKGEREERSVIRAKNDPPPQSVEQKLANSSSHGDKYYNYWG